ncbi:MULTISPECIES: class I SAM-dependent methyltransferase [Methylosinus]|uniref:SAM-dependent methyltransferase n=2 Tax=Methylosinus TaxID=425 RepID=A0A2D2CZD4_METT3|nr:MULTISPECIES: class I SAM-dependent methyltransferase [Methylosinus]ATQ68097.1 SAM-dependent methyltransferase [Methylosinus trichosporium OB3b]OBS54344.1 methyltransferase type 11 [Methylosinus sp. 3S-1]
MPLRRKFSRLHDLLSLRMSRYFNADWYLHTYPDVKATGLDPARHYLDHGAAEKRDPSWAFSTAAYLDSHPEVARAGVNPLLHFIRAGGCAGRAEPAPSVRGRAAPLADAPALVDVDATFDRLAGERRPARVLEAGTLQSNPGHATHSHRRFPWVAQRDYVKLDIVAGLDVDVVGDLHALPAHWSGTFDCVLANAVFEHLERPWIAAREIARVLAPGGLFLVSTHQSFPLHAYPSDFFRFSREALRLIFEDAGLVVDAADYKHRCAILPPAAVMPSRQVGAWNATFPSFILVQAAGHRSENG